MSISTPRNTTSSGKSRRHRKSGMALIITLSLIVLVTVAAMAFFTRATSNTVVEASRAQRIMADQLFLTSRDYVNNRFLQEIGNNSTASTVSGAVVYQPTAPSNAVPQVLVSAGTTGTAFTNLVRQSVPGADPNASSDNTATPSRSGRAIGATRWNAPMLTPGGGFTDANQTPNWIYLCADGTVTKDVTGANASQIVGRFAYNAYNIGGLLDANVAGYPSVLTNAGASSITNLAAIKGTLAGADLTRLGISGTTADTLITFRNPQASASAAAYTNYVLGAARTGFLSSLATNLATGATTNNFFVTRQDLIRYASNNNPDLTNALPYLTHYSRELNAPSWTPTTNTTISYAASADTTSSTNRNIPNVRVTRAFTRLDGSTAQVGEPLIKSRFPLSRLCWLQDNTLTSGSFDSTPRLTNDLALINGVRANRGQPALTTAALIQQTFGLVWNAGSYRWDYCGATGSTLQTSIATLDAVAAAGREPNYFELLKAGILSSSVGLGVENSGCTTAAVQRSSDFQILRIGACSIDQVKTDSYPTRIAYSSPINTTWVACGVQRLPYISRWTQVPIRNTAATDANTLTPLDYQFAVVIVPVLSNPFQGSDLQGTNDNKLIPLPPFSQRPNVRITIQGLVMTWDGGWNPGSSDNQVISPTSLNLTVSGRDSNSSFGQDSYITTTDASGWVPSGPGPYSGRGWEQFMAPNAANGNTWSEAYVQSANPPVANTGRGLPVGFRLAPRDPFSTNATPNVVVWYGGDGAAPANPFQLSMEFQAPNGSWYPYSMAAGVEGDNLTWPAGLYAYCANLTGGNFGEGANWEGTANNTWNNNNKWVNMVPYSYAGNGGVWQGAVVNYAVSDFDFVANFCQVIVKADPRSIRFNTVGSNNRNLQGLANGGRLTRGLWNTPQSAYRNDVANYTSVQKPPSMGSPPINRYLQAPAAADGGFAVNEQNPNAIYRSTPPTLRNLPFPPNSTTAFFPALLCRNTGANGASAGANGAVRASYTDPDGVQRVADCGLYPDPLWNGSVTSNGNPYMPYVSNTIIGNNPDRPVVLNRPFRSVSELGYVFRDQPFKTLDFFSRQSADAALLDLFCVNENIASPLRSGVVNLNGAKQPVLSALLSGIVTREQATPVTLLPATASNVAVSLVTTNSVTPMRTLADLASFIATQTNANAMNSCNKAALESIARALADTTQTRTWNLLVDLVVQSGRFLPNDPRTFIIQGETSAWNSVAIDRPLGKIVDQQLEYVIAR